MTSPKPMSIVSVFLMESSFASNVRRNPGYSFSIVIGSEAMVSGRNITPSSGTCVFITCMNADLMVAESRLILVPMKSMSKVGRGTNSSQANNSEPPFKMKCSL